MDLCGLWLATLGLLFCTVKQAHIVLISESEAVKSLA